MSARVGRVATGNRAQRASWQVTGGVSTRERRRLRNVQIDTWQSDCSRL